MAHFVITGFLFSAVFTSHFLIYTHADGIPLPPVAACFQGMSEDLYMNPASTSLCFQKLKLRVSFGDLAIDAFVKACADKKLNEPDDLFDLILNSGN